jgi:hypothetical protein
LADLLLIPGHQKQASEPGDLTITLKNPAFKRYLKRKREPVTIDVCMKAIGAKKLITAEQED